MRVALIVNPRAGRKRGLATACAAEPELRAGGWHVERKVTDGPGGATRLAREAADEGFEAVLACGGDGTLGQVLGGLLDTGIPAGMVPAGTGNDFARTVGLSQEPMAAARQLISGHAAPIDLLSINDGALWAANVIGAGFDAQVAERMNRRRRLAGGTFAYLVGIAQELVWFRPTEVRLRADDTEWEGRALLVAVANAKSYGGGMKVAPQAEIDDGLLDVVVVEHMGRLEFVRNLPKVFKGTHVTHPAVHVWQAKEVEVETAAPAPTLVDGDVQCETPLHVRVAAGRGRFWMPGPA
jgi:YegS/Rv2252/BmrU family lipid kinase